MVIDTEKKISNRAHSAQSELAVTETIEGNLGTVMVGRVVAGWAVTSIANSGFQTSGQEQISVRTAISVQLPDIKFHVYQWASV